MTRKLPWTQEDVTHFRLDDFYSFCKRNNWELDKIKTGNLIKQLDFFVDESRITLEKSTPRVIKIKAMKEKREKKQEVKYQETPF
mgnify:FL=1